MVILFGLLLSLMPPLLFVSVLLLVRRPQLWRNYLWMCVLGLALFAYSYEPTTSSDTYRYYYLIEQLGRMSFSDALFRSDYSGHYILNIWFWIAGKLGSPNLVALTTVAVVYGISGYITCDYAERMEKTELIPKILLIQFLLLPYFSIINNIRNVTAFSIICLAAYRDLSKHKRNVGTILLYIIPCLIHSSAISLVILRLLVPLAKKRPIITFALAFFVSTFIDLAYNNIAIFQGSSVITQSIIKAYRYSSDEYAATGYGAAYRTYWWNNVNYVVCMAYAVLTVLFTFPKVLDSGKLVLRRFKIEDSLTNFIFLICVMIFATNVFNAPHYWRYAAALSMLVGYMFINKNMEFNSFEIGQVSVWILCISFGFLQTIRLLPVVLQSGCLTNFLINNPITIIVIMFV